MQTCKLQACKLQAFKLQACKLQASVTSINFYNFRQAPRFSILPTDCQFRKAESRPRHLDRRPDGHLRQRQRALSEVVGGQVLRQRSFSRQFRPFGPFAAATAERRLQGWCF